MTEKPSQVHREEEKIPQGGQDFQELLDEYDYEPPKRGQVLDGTVMSVEEDKVLVDVGAKRDAVVPRQDLNRLGEEDLKNIREGDELSVYVLKPPTRIRDKLIVSISQGLAQEDWERAAELEESGEVVELEVTGKNRGGLEVKFGRLRGFVPNSHIPGIRHGLSNTELSQRKEELIGEKMLLGVIEVNRQRRRLILSGRAAEKERRVRRLKELETGQVVEGTVVNIVDFGAFVNLGAVDGLIHISELSWDNVEHPSEVVEVNEKVEVEVKDVDVDRERVSLSLKSLKPSPWDSAAERYSVGDLVEGEVTNVVKFGAFVALPDGIEGLIHTSEMNLLGSEQPGELFHPGDRVLTRIVQLEPEEERIGLSTRRVTEEEQVNWSYEKRQEVETVEPSEAEAEEGADEPVEDFDALMEEIEEEQIAQEIPLETEDAASGEAGGTGEMLDSPESESEAMEEDREGDEPEAIEETGEGDEPEAMEEKGEGDEPEAMEETGEGDEDSDEDPSAEADPEEPSAKTDDEQVKSGTR